jgi:lysophospholipase L1-like esterase
MDTPAALDLAPPETRYDDDVVTICEHVARRGRDRPALALFGSSSFRLWLRMAEDLDSVDLVNLGFGGGTAASALRYFDRLFAALRPGRVALYFGENDITNEGLTAATALARVLELRDRIAAALGPVDVHCLSVKHSPSRWLYRHEFDRFNADLARACVETPNTYFVDVTTSLIGENGMPIGACYQADGLHLNAAGYLRWARVLRAAPRLLLPTP